MLHHSAGATIQVANFVNYNRHPQAPRGGQQRDCGFIKVNWKIIAKHYIMKANKKNKTQSYKWSNKLESKN